MESITYNNVILTIDDKPANGNQIRSMTDTELKELIHALYDIGYNDGYSIGCEVGYTNGYEKGWKDRSYDIYGEKR